MASLQNQAVFAVILTCSSMLPAADRQDSKVQPPDPAAAVSDAATKFIANIRDGKAQDNAKMFLKDDVVISGISRVREPKAWQKKPAEYVKDLGVHPRYLAIDSVESSLIHDGLGVARVRYRIGGAKVYAVVTMALDKGQWKIASLFEESHFVW